MVSSQGWVQLHRKLKDCWIWKDKEPFDKRSAWVDLILTANHSDNKIFFNGTLMTIERGQILTSVRKLSERWRWSKDRTHRFLKVLAQDGMIVKDSDNERTLITLVNYGIYQLRRDTNKDTLEDSDNTPPRTPSSHKQQCNNNSNKVDEYGEPPPLSIEDIEGVWHKTFKVYPKKKNQENAKRIWMQIISRKPQEEHLNTAITIYRAIEEWKIDHAITNPDDATSFSFAKPFDEWLSEESGYWMREVEELRKRRAEE